MDYESYLDIGAPSRPLFRQAGTRATREERIRMGATRLGISVEAYELHVEAGERWCSGHKRWCPADDFAGDKGSCRAGHAAYTRERRTARKRAEARPSGGMP